MSGKDGDNASKRTASLVVPKTQSEHEHVKEQMKNPKDTDRYPHLNAFIERGMGTRFSKKTRFTYDNRHAINDQVIDQMKERDDKNVNDKVDKILQERRLIQENRRQMA